MSRSSMSPTSVRALTVDRFRAGALGGGGRAGGGGGGGDDDDDDGAGGCGGGEAGGTPCNLSVAMTLLSRASDCAGVETFSSMFPSACNTKYESSAIAHRQGSDTTGDPKVTDLPSGVVRVKV